MLNNNLKPEFYNMMLKILIKDFNNYLEECEFTYKRNIIERPDINKDNKCN